MNLRFTFVDVFDETMVYIVFLIGILIIALIVLSIAVVYLQVSLSLQLFILFIVAMQLDEIYLVD